MNLTGMPKVELDDVVVAGNGYYPDLSTAYFVKHYAVAADYVEQVEPVLKTAQAEVGQQLETLMFTNGTLLNEQQAVFYKNAVYALAKAKILISRLGSTHRDQSAAQQQAAVDNQRYWLEDSQNNVRLLALLSPTASVELL
jgi:hypothetical protein